MKTVSQGVGAALWGLPVMVAIAVFQFVSRPPERFQVEHRGDGTLHVRDGVYAYTFDEPFELHESDSKNKRGVTVHNVCVRTAGQRATGRQFCNVPSGPGPFLGNEDFDNIAEVERSETNWNRRWIGFGLGSALWFAFCVARALVLERRRQGQITKLAIHPAEKRLVSLAQNGETKQVDLSHIRHVGLVGESTLVLTLSTGEDDVRIKLGDLAIGESYELIEKLQDHLS